MLPRIKSELSLINSLIELKDFKTVGRTVSNLRKTVATLGKRVRRGQTLKQVLRSSADSYLQAQFNFLPLISDINGFIAAVYRAERRMNDLVTRSGRPRDMHFAYKWQELPASTYASGSGTYRYKVRNSTPTWPGDNQISTSTFLERFSYSEPSSFHAQIQYNYNYTEYQLVHARMNAFLDSLGINYNPAIIWNAIPWSFVVDWVFGVSQWLNQFKVGMMDPKINIRRYLWSIKRSRRIIVQHSDVNYITPGTHRNPYVPYPTVTEEAYRRSVALPTASSIVSGGLNFKEFSLGAALVISRRRRRKT
jgi:hypothetical protein